MPQCVDDINIKYMHPKYMIRLPSIQNTFASNAHLKNDNIYFDRKTNDKETEGFDLKVFLGTVYHIFKLEDLLKWIENSDELDEDTVCRVIDLVWDGIITREVLEDGEEFDVLLSVYKRLYPKESENRLSTVLQKVGKEYLGAELSYNSKKSYHKLIKKHLG